MDSYDPNLEEFSGRRENAVFSSIWTLKKFTVFLDEATNNRTIREKLKKNKIIFFFHLLGIDTAGHSHKPHSQY